MSRRGLKQKVLALVLAVTKAGTFYTSSFPFHDLNGGAALFLISTAGSITVTQQCSLNDSDWYDPLDASGAAVGSVAAAVTVTTGRWVSYSPVFAPYVRFKIVEGNVAATNVSMQLLYQEEI